MRKSKVLGKLKAGENVCCLKINLSNVQVAEIAALSGFDCLWLDMEHIAQDWSVIYAQNLAAKVYDTDVMVRVSRGSYSDYVKPFELDATGVMVPHVMNVEDARKIIRMTRFYPYGRRPLDGGNSDGAYTALDFDKYMKHSNGQRFTVLQIEDPEPMDELDAIAALEGFDMLFFGPGDFSQGIGFPGQWEHPELLKARERVATTARKHGKFAGTTGHLSNLDKLTELGYQFISIGADVIGLTGYCKSLQEGFRLQNRDKINGLK